MLNLPKIYIFPKNKIILKMGNMCYNEYGGASVRRIVYSWWKSNMVIPSKEPSVNLGAEIARLGLSVDKQEFEP